MDIGAEAFGGLGSLAWTSDLVTLVLFGRACSAAILGDSHAPMRDLATATARVATRAPEDRLLTCTMTSLLHLLLGNDEEAAASAAVATTLVETSGGPPWSSFAAMLAILTSEPFDVAAFRESLGPYETQGYHVAASLFRLLAASKALARGDEQEAKTCLDANDWSSLCVVERCWGAEQSRLRAGLLMLGGKASDSEIEGHFRRAVETAREHGARLWEIRASEEYDEFLRGREREGGGGEMPLEHRQRIARSAPGGARRPSSSSGPSDRRRQ